MANHATIGTGGRTVVILPPMALSQTGSLTSVLGAPIDIIDPTNTKRKTASIKESIWKGRMTQRKHEWIFGRGQGERTFPHAHFERKTNNQTVTKP